MSFGVTSAGFQKKRLADIKTEIETRLKADLGANINLLPSSVLGQLVGIFSERESLLWELAEAVYNAHYPKTSSGITLDQVVSLTGLTRQPGLSSSVNLTFLGTVGTIIPAGSVFSVDGDETARFLLGSEQTIQAGQNEIQTINFDLVPDSGDFKLTLGASTTTALAFNATSQDIENALNALAELSSVLVAGDFSSGFTVNFQGADGLKDQETLTVTDNNLLNGVTPVALSFVVSQEGFPNRVIALVESEALGEVSAPSGSLTVIENPISGLDSVTNELDATLGREVETDSALKARREDSLQRAGASVLGAIAAQISDIDSVLAVVAFENITFLTDIDGRPPKSFEMIVQGGDQDEIAQKIWDTKPAGIESFGSVVRTITDSQGFVQTVKFSRPTEVNIYIEIDLTTDSNFPSDGLTQARDAILAFGNALEIGEDVVVYPKLISSLNGITGILDVAIRIGSAASPTLDDNIVIAPAEISAWDSSRVTVNEL